MIKVIIRVVYCRNYWSDEEYKSKLYCYKIDGWEILRESHEYIIVMKESNE